MSTNLPSGAAPLPRKEWLFHSCGPDHIAIAMHEWRGYACWTRMALDDIPNMYASLADLSRVVIISCDLGKVERLERLLRLQNARA